MLTEVHLRHRDFFLICYNRDDGYLLFSAINSVINEPKNVYLFLSIFISFSLLKSE